MAMEEIKGEVWCDVHGCVHGETNDPYNYGYEEAKQMNGGTYPEGFDPECGPEDWRKLWAGRSLAKEVPNE